MALCIKPQKTGFELNKYSKYDSLTLTSHAPGSSLPPPKGTNCPSLWGTAWYGETTLPAVPSPPTSAQWTRWVPRIPLTYWYMVVGLCIAVVFNLKLCSPFHSNNTSLQLISMISIHLYSEKTVRGCCCCWVGMKTVDTVSSAFLSSRQRFVFCSFNVRLNSVVWHICLYINPKGWEARLPLKHTNYPKCPPSLLDPVVFVEY